MTTWLMMMCLGSALAAEPPPSETAWLDDRPSEPMPRTIQALVNQAQVVLVLKVDHHAPWSGEELPFGAKATEIHFTVVEAIKGGTAKDDVWFPIPNDMFAEHLFTNIGTEILVFGKSSYEADPRTDNFLVPLYTAPYVSLLVRGPGDVVRDLLAEPITISGPAGTPRRAQDEPATWTELLGSTRAAAARSLTKNAITLGVR